MAYFKKDNNRGQGGKGPGKGGFERKGSDFKSGERRSPDGKNFGKGPGGKGPDRKDFGGPSYGQKRENYGQKRDDFDPDRKSFERKPGFDQGKPEYGNKKPGFGQGKPGFGQGKPGFDKRKSGYDPKKPGGKSFGQKGPGGRGPANKGYEPKWPVEKQDDFKRKEILPEAPAAENDETEEYVDRIEGRNPVMEAIKSGRTIDKIMVSKGEKEGSIRQIIYMAKEKGIVVQEVDRTRLDIMSATRSHQGIIAFAAMKEYVEVEDILQIAADKKEPAFIIILDEITDPHNLGSILRTADAVGVHGVIIPKRRSVGLSAIVAKSSAGAMEYVPVARVANIPQTIEKLKKNNVWIMGTDMDGEKAFYDHDLKGAVAVVVGSEGEGMGKLVKESCDFIVKIPMVGKIASLNASVAGAVVMYEVFRQRKGL